VLPGLGHKTGWFCDQRDNRRRVASFAAGLDVLDLCCNLGGFGLSAARAGARRVLCVDLDEVALERAQRAAQLNHLGDVLFRHEDAFHTLRAVGREKRRPGLVVLDPHKLIRGKSNLEEGKKRYLDMNALALAAVAPGGLCATFSCSGALDLPGFLGLVFQAARRAEREVRVLEVYGAGPDHPQRPVFPRSRYLKGALLAVD
jgi:23S rRNA (cytosine1962-C5)-methyltransferase